MKKEKIEQIKNLILNRVKFHAPIVYDDEIDKTVLFNNGIDTNMPIFVYKKELNKTLIKAFRKASEEANFNLLIPIENVSLKEEKALKKIKNCVFYSKKSNFKLLSMINKLNINYFSSSNYDLKFKDKFVKINEEIINPKYDDFALIDSGRNEVFYDYKEFQLNGNNIYLKLKNYDNFPKKTKISLNFPLKQGYYLFKKQNNSIKIINLMTKEVSYFSYICPKAQFNFSAVDGLENSLFSTINLNLTFSLKAMEERFFFFIMSNKKFSLKAQKDIEKLFSLSKQKCYETFDLRVKTKNPKFDQFFNNELPKKIWLNWNNNLKNDALSGKYATLRRLFIKGKDKINVKPFKEIGVKELGIFNGEYYKKILISFGNQKFLQVGETKFTNISNITRFSLKKKEPIFLSFDA